MSTQNIETPWSFFRAVEQYFNIEFDYDMAASAENAKCKKHLNMSLNSLKYDWPLEDWCWLNPPFRNLSVWIWKCKHEMERGSRIISIWPLSGDLNQLPAWKYSDVYVIHGRIWSLVRSIMLCVWDKERPTGVTGLRWDGSTLVKAWSK